MLHKIDHSELYNSKEELICIALYIDDKRFIMDKPDVWNLFSISQTVFDKMKDKEIKESELWWIEDVFDNNKEP